MCKQHQDISKNRRRRSSLKNLWTAIIGTPEGHILLTGLTLSLLYLVWLLIYSIWNPNLSHIFFAMTATHFLLGRAAGMSFGYTVGFEHHVVILLNLVIETIQVLLFYPLFVFSWHKLVSIKRLNRMMAHIHQAAENNRQVILRYGILGLMAFVWIPFWMTGSAVGCVIGFVLKLHPWLTIGVVLGGAYLAILSWAFLLQELHHRASEFGPYASLGIFAAIILAIVINHFRHKIKRKKSSS